jgi:hypothetical protein
VVTLELSVGMADRALFLAGPLPEVGETLELCAGDMREVVLVESYAGAGSVWVQRAYQGQAAEWRRGQCLRMPLEFTAIYGGWWECSLCCSPVTSGGRDRHAQWHEELRASA